MFMYTPYLWNVYGYVGVLSPHHSFVRYSCVPHLYCSGNQSLTNQLSRLNSDPFHSIKHVMYMHVYMQVTTYHSQGLISCSSIDDHGLLHTRHSNMCALFCYQVTSLLLLWGGRDQASFSELV